MAVAAVAAAGLGLGNLWGYNRDNFMYDRRMRQETELTVAEWRTHQATQWREDVRDLTGLTETKMASYMMVNTLQLSMCVVLFTEGRLQPGTPHWLLHLYMLTLSTAFMYLVMSVWLAMHAMVVVACEKAKLLTQFVRLPIPTWSQFDKMRTAAAAYERLGKRSFRVPFMDTVVEPHISDITGAGASTGPGSNRKGAPATHHSPACHTKGTMPMSASGHKRLDALPENHGAPEGCNDTWGLESYGDEVLELAQRPLHSNRHVNLVRRAQTHYQCHDAFARISMTFGTTQLLLALSYFTMGYMLVGDGAPWPAIIIVIITVSISVAIVQLDISFTRCQQFQAFFLTVTGPALATMSAVAWCMPDHRWHRAPEFLLGPCYLAHGLWLLWALRACQVTLHPGGAMLPTTFRLTTYLDVFGWIRHQQNQVKEQRQVPSKTDGDYKRMQRNGKDIYSSLGAPAPATFDPMDVGIHDNPLTCTVKSSEATKRNHRERARLVSEVGLTLESWQSEDTMQMVDEYTKKRIRGLTHRLHAIGEKIPSPSSPSSPKRGSESKPLPNLVEYDVQEGSTAASQAFERHASYDSQATLGWDSEVSTLKRDPADLNTEQWLKGTYYTDVGTEVPYDYDPDTGQVRHTHVTSPRSSPSKPTPKASFSSMNFGATPAAGGNWSVGSDHKVYSSEGESRPLLRSLSGAEDAMDELDKLDVQSEKLSARSRDHLEQTLRDLPKCPAGELPGEGKKGHLQKLSARAADLARSAKYRSKGKAADVAPWLFGDLQRQPTTSLEKQPLKRCNTAWRDGQNERSDCPNEVVVNDHGQGESATDAGDEVDKDEIVMSMGPDKLPWQVFRSGTLIIVFLWLISPLMLFGWYPYGRSEFGPQTPWAQGPKKKKVKSFAEQEDPDGTFSGMVIDNRDLDYDLEPTIEDYESMPSLPPGQPIDVHWPFESTFTPRALTVDNTGKHLVISEDFGVYFGQVVDGRVAVEESDFFGPSLDGDGYGMQPRLLRGAKKWEKVGGEWEESRSRASFMHMPHCTALEGKQLKDVAVVCSNGEAMVAFSKCRVLLLHSNGRRITECPLFAPWGTAQSGVSEPESSDGDLRGNLNPTTPVIVNPMSEWQIAGSWLDHDSESVESLAVNPECSGSSSADHAFDPAEVGCVVVGTSSGRVVQLRRHVSKKHSLVPEWAMQERRGKVAQGSLQVFPGGYVLMLRSEIGVMQAINAEKGTILGQWRLPDDANWFSLSGGGTSLYMMGHKKPDESSDEDDSPVTLWKFPLPPKLETLFAAYNGPPAA